MAEQYQKFTAIVEAMESDFEKFYDKEVGAAGTRVRKGMLDLKKLAGDIRSEVQAAKNKADGKKPAAKKAAKKK